VVTVVPLVGSSPIGDETLPPSRPTEPLSLLPLITQGCPTHEIDRQWEAHSNMALFLRCSRAGPFFILVRALSGQAHPREHVRQGSSEHDEGGTRRARSPRPAEASGMRVRHTLRAQQGEGPHKEVSPTPPWTASHPAPTPPRLHLILFCRVEMDVEIGEARGTEGPKVSLRVRTVSNEVWAEQFKRAGIDDKDETTTGCIIIELPLKVLYTVIATQVNFVACGLTRLWPVR
jgi:hypothetical protein